MKKIIEKAAAFFKTYGHKIFTFCVGLAFIALVCFGVITVAKSIYRVFKPDNIYADPTYENTVYGGSVYEVRGEDAYEEGTAEFFEEYIENVIKQDMPDFDDPLDLNDEYMISFGVWQAITLNNTQGIYTYDEKGNFRIPADDVEMFASYCFDYASKYKHRSVENCGEFKYSAINKTYTVKSAGISSVYLVPDVVDVVAGENDTYTLTVDCYQADMLSAADPTNDPKNIVKSVEIVLQDMGIQSYDTETGVPVHRYMYLSMDTVDTDKQAVQDEVDLN